jgi:hypothetical protein
MAYESESDHGDNDDEGDEFDIEDNDNDDDDDDFASRTAEAGGGPDNDDDRSSSSSPSSSDNEEECDDDDDDDDNACEESWFLDSEGRKDVVVIVNDKNDRPNDCNHLGNDTDISKAKGKTKAKANATTTKAKTKTNAKDDKKKRGTSGRISTAASVKASAVAPKKTGVDARKKKEKAKHQHSPRRTDIHRNNKRSRILHRQRRPTATASSPTMTSLSAVKKHKLYVSNRILTDHAQPLVSTKVNDLDSLIASMNNLITPENKKNLVTRILTLSSYGDSSNTGPLGSIDEMYLNHIVDQDLFDRISDNDQAGLLMEKNHSRRQGLVW